MASIFDLATNIKQIPLGNLGVNRMQYEQHPPTRNVVGEAFPNGSIHMRWHTSGLKWWLPSRSYLRMRVKIQDEAGAQLTTAKNVAPNMGLAASLFQSMEFRINDKTVSRISDFVSQVDAIETRLNKSKGWIDTVGNSSNLWQSKQSDRHSLVVNDGQYDTSTRTDRLGLNVPGATTLAIDAAGAITLDAYPGSDLSVVFAIGDEIEVVVSAGEVVKYTIARIAGLVLHTNSATTVLGASAYAFSRIRKDSSRQAGEIELIWQPPLSVFKIAHALPSGKYELILNPHPSAAYQKYAVETSPLNIQLDPNLNYSGAASAGSTYQVRIEDMYMYVNTVEGERADDITYLLDLEQTNCQSDDINSANFSQRNFEVSPSTYALSIAYQDARAGADSRISSTKFKVYRDDPADATKLLAATDENNLTRFFIQYAGQSVPSPDSDPNFTAGIDNTTQRYIESQLYSGSYDESGGAEDIEEFHQRGSYYHFLVPRESTDRSTRVTVHQQFSSLGVNTTARVLLFDHSKQIARIKVVNGTVEDVQLEDN